MNSLFQRAALAALALSFCPAAFGAELWPDLSKPPSGLGGGEKDAAVIVGAENYLLVAKVPGARDNAQAWHAYLADSLKVPTHKISLLRDNEATVEKMRRFAAKAAADVEPGGTLWFVFIGHGTPSKDGSDGMLVGADAQQDADSLFARSLPRAELLSILNKGRQAKTVVLLDACFSGRTPSGEPLLPGLQPLVLAASAAKGDGRTILLTAAKSDQFAGPLPKSSKPRPAFSYLALGALRGWAADAEGRVTAGAIVDFALRALSLDKGRVQTPELSAGAGSVVLGRGREPAPDFSRIDRQSESAAALSGPAPIPGKGGVEWISLPGGAFLMGDEGTSQRRVQVKPFLMARTPVTRKQYAACVEAGGCSALSSKMQFLDRDAPEDAPIGYITWEEAAQFSAWVGGRLPSEAEWEYAARSAGKPYPYPWGYEKPTCKRTVYGRNDDPDCHKGVLPVVCSRPRGNTEQGLCDMIGTFREWTADWWYAAAEAPPGELPQLSGPAQVKTEHRVLRGGLGVESDRSDTGAAFRAPSLDRSSGRTGFRPVRDP